MADVTVKVLDNAPLLVTGKINLVDGEGSKLETKEETYLCRCGKSKNTPFCDGSHEGNFQDVVRTK